MAEYRVPIGQILAHGALAGIIAGAVMAGAVTAIGVALWGVEWDEPLRWVGAIGVGVKGLRDDYGLEHVILPGLLIHFGLAALYGVIFLWIVTAARLLLASTPVLLLFGAMYGTALWLLNFYVIVPNSYYFWFAGLDGPWISFLPHTVFYGPALGGFVAATRPGSVGDVADRTVGAGLRRP